MLTNYLGEDVKKTVDKAQDKISEAGRLIQESNEYYNEALALQSNYELDEKTLQKNIKSAEDKAVSTQIKADKLYAAAYKSLYELCEKSLGEYTILSGDPAEEYVKKASELMAEAAVKRKAVSNTGSAYEKAALLNDASGMENAAIENMILAIQLVQGMTVAETTDEEISEVEAETATTDTDYSSTISPTYETDEQVNKDLTIDYGSVNQYNEYVADPSSPDPVTLTAAGVTGVNDVSFDAAREQLHEYNYGDRMLVDESVMAVPEELAQQESVQEKVDPTSGINEQVVQPVKEIPTFDSDVPETDERSETSTSYRPVSAASMAISEVRFMVQIAASRVPLTRAQVSAIYPGNLTVEVMQEDRWFKYRITGYRLYSDASSVVRETGVRGAWVISTYSGERTSLADAREKIRDIESDIKNYGRNAFTNDRDYYVQLAASRVRLGDEDVTRICGETSQCREIIEEGWFKYQIYAGTNFQEALRIQESISRKSFIVAYRMGAKMNFNTSDR